MRVQPVPSTAPYFLRRRGLAQRWSVNPATIWRMEKRGDLPAPTRITPGIVAWRSDVIERIEAERTPTNESAPTRQGQGR